MVTRRGFIGVLLGLPLLAMVPRAPAWRVPQVRTPDNLLTPTQVIERANADGRSYALVRKPYELTRSLYEVSFFVGGVRS